MNWNTFSSTQCMHQMESVSSTVECCQQNIIFNSYSGSNQLFFNKKVECCLQTIIFHSCRSQLLWSTQWMLSVNYYMKQYMYVNLPYKAYGVSWGAKHKNSQVCRELEVLIGSVLQRFQSPNIRSMVAQHSTIQHTTTVPGTVHTVQCVIVPCQPVELCRTGTLQLWTFITHDSRNAKHGHTVVSCAFVGKMEGTV